MDVQKLIMLGVMLCPEKDHTKATIFCDAIMKLDKEIDVMHESLENYFDFAISVSCYRIPNLFKANDGRFNIADCAMELDQVKRDSEVYDHVAQNLKNEFFDAVF